MSAPQQPSRERAGGYQRSSSGLLGAMIATVVLVLAFVGFRALTRDNAATPVPAIDFTISLQAGRADHKLLMFAPPAVPSGWKATSAAYVPGDSPSWHLGLLTAKQEYVGVEESTSSVGDALAAKVNAGATRHGSVTIGGQAWQVYSGGGDYALVRTIPRARQDPETLLVVGTAPDATVRDFAGSLRSS